MTNRRSTIERLIEALNDVLNRAWYNNTGTNIGKAPKWVARASRTLRNARDTAAQISYSEVVCSFPQFTLLGLHEIRRYLNEAIKEAERRECTD